MAVYIPIRPRWNPRGQVVNYISYGHLCARGWPGGYRDANTSAQRAQRGKMAQVCDVLPFLKALLAEGYSPIVKRNGRHVGAYHSAVSVALRDWFDATPNGAQINMAKIRLTEGIHQLPKGFSAALSGGKIRIAWRNALKWQGAKLLFAARHTQADKWVAAPIALEQGAEGVTLTLPKHWVDCSIEIWVALVGDGGRIKTTTYHCALAAAAAHPTPSATPVKEYTSISIFNIARKGPRRATARRAGNPLKRPPNACKFRLTGHCCVVKKGAKG